MKHDYNHVRDALASAQDPKTSRQGAEYRQLRDDRLLQFVEYHAHVLDSALAIADALMREPSDAMCMEGVRGAHGDSSGETINIYSAVFKAMRDQLLKEVATGDNLLPVQKEPKPCE